MLTKRKNGLAEWLMLYLSMQMEFGGNLLKVDCGARQKGQHLMGGMVRSTVLPECGIWAQGGLGLSG